MPKQSEGTKTDVQPKVTRNEANYGGWKFARDFSNGVFSLLNSGKIFPVFGLLVLVLMGIIAWRLPASDLAEIIRDFFATIRSSFGFALSSLVVSNLMWAWLIRRQRRIFQDEIDRLAEIRNKLIHGDNPRTPLKDHHTSDGQQQESYLLPEPPPQTIRKKR